MKSQRVGKLKDANIKIKKAEVTTLISEKTEFKTECIFKFLNYFRCTEKLKCV